MADDDLPQFTPTEPPTATRGAARVPPPARLPSAVVTELQRGPSSGVERAKVLAASFGFEALFRGAAMLIGAIAAAALTIRPVITDLRAPAPIDPKHLERIAEIEQELAKNKAERALIATWAETITEHSIDERNDKRRIRALGEAACAMNGGRPGPGWPECDAWTQRNVKNSAQGHQTTTAW